MIKIVKIDKTVKIDYYQVACKVPESDPLFLAGRSKSILCLPFQCRAELFFWRQNLARMRRDLREAERCRRSPPSGSRSLRSLVDVLRSR